jgi:formylglycine-generating enzyme required for sulfatase activity
MRMRPLAAAFVAMAGLLTIDSAFQRAAAQGSAPSGAAALEAERMRAAGFVLVPGGSFVMGAQAGDALALDDEARIQRSVSSFYISAFELRLSEFAAFVAETGYVTVAERGLGPYIRAEGKWGHIKGASWRNPGYEQGPSHPVSCLSFMDAVEFCNWKSWKEGLAPAYSIKDGILRCDFSSRGYRLPTEAEWEYAAKGGPYGAGSAYPGSANPFDVAWYDATSGLAGPRPVGTRAPNALGLYDMAGNVEEWCWDWYGPYAAIAAGPDPRGPEAGFWKVSRGGSWLDPAILVRVSYRGRLRPDYAASTTGFRLCRNP